MKSKYVTITGINHYYGLKPFKIGKKFKCKKEKDNVYDSEAIKVVGKEIGTIGYIANSTYTVATGTMSAGRIYEKVGNTFYVKVKFIIGNSVIAKVVNKNLDETFDVGFFNNVSFNNDAINDLIKMNLFKTPKDVSKNNSNNSEDTKTDNLGNTKNNNSINDVSVEVDIDIDDDYDDDFDIDIDDDYDDFDDLF